MNMAIRNMNQGTSIQAESDMRACRRLWASVVRTAADDLQAGLVIMDKAKRCYMGPASSAAAWFASESNEIGSFLWACDILDLNAQAVRRAITNGAIKNSHGRYAALLMSFNKDREVPDDEAPDQAL